MLRRRPGASAPVWIALVRAPEGFLAATSRTYGSLPNAGTIFAAAGRTRHDAGGQKSLSGRSQFRQPGNPVVHAAFVMALLSSRRRCAGRRRSSLFTVLLVLRVTPCCRALSVTPSPDPITTALTITSVAGFFLARIAPLQAVAAGTSCAAVTAGVAGGIALTRQSTVTAKG